ncbi:hypothetical protein GCM10027570_12490 [Streptomonospora sediminis]
MSAKTTTALAALVTAGFFSVAPAALADDDTQTSGNGSILGGNQIIGDVDIPVNVCGNGIAVLGTAGAACEGSGASTGASGTSGGSGGGASVSESEGDTTTSGNGSVLGGNQVGVDGDVPVNACGNAVGVLGNAGADCEGGHKPPHDEPEPDKPTDEPTDKPTEPEDHESESPSPSEPEESESPSEAPSSPADEAPPADAGAAPPAHPEGELPRTGTGLLPMVAAAAGSVAVGLGVLAVVRRRGRRSL